jgi:hypothetical protein
MTQSSDLEVKTVAALYELWFRKRHAKTRLARRRYLA